MKEKLNHLNEEQEELMITVRNEYLSKFFTYKDIDKKKCQEFINSIYKDINLPSPLLIITDSPLGCQYTANLLKILDENKKFVSDNVSDNVWDNVRDNVSANVSDNVWDNVRDNVSANVWANVWDNVRDNVSANVWDNVWANVWDNVRVNVSDNVRDNVWDNVRVNVWDNVRDNVSANVRVNVRDNVWANVSDNVSDNVWDNVWANVWDNVWANVRDNVSANVSDNVRDNVSDNVSANVWANVSDNVRDNVWDNVRVNVWANVWDNVRVNVSDNVWDNVSDNVSANVWDNVWANVRDNVSANVWANVRDNVWANVRDNVSDNVWDNVRDNVWANVRVNVRDKKLEFFSFGSYIGCSALSWTAFYDYFTRIGILDHEKFNEYKKHTDLSIYDTIQLKNVCIVSRLPISIKRKGMRLHSEDSPAIEFKDGYKLYYWSGLTVPEKLIMSPETITKNDILSISNAEVRRCYMEKLGAKKYYDILSDGKGLKLIDSCIDNQGNIMKLWETTINDDIINKKVQFLECECPSTHRIYNIYPPNQQSKTCKEAKYSTFLNVKGKYRQGDVMLQDISKDYDNCLVET